MEEGHSSIPQDPAALADRYLTGLLGGDRREVVRLIEEGLACGIPAATLQQSVIRKAQEEIGRLWQTNRISIAQEHMATAIAQVALAHIFDHAPPPRPNGWKLVMACVEGELHDFPARLMADALELVGFQLHYLGANVPTASLLSLLEAEPPHLLALSCTLSFHLPALQDAIEQVRRQQGERFPILVGGRALGGSPAEAEALGVVAPGDEPLSVVGAAYRLLT
jgi:methanogenic corrinoid protein MtbC1